MVHDLAVHLSSCGCIYPKPDRRTPSMDHFLISDGIVFNLRTPPQPTALNSTSYTRAQYLCSVTAMCVNSSKLHINLPPTHTHISSIPELSNGIVLKLCTHSSLPVFSDGIVC